MKYTRVYRDDDSEIVITVQRVRSVMPPRSYEEKLMDGATKKSYRKAHRYGDRPAFGKRGR